MIPLQFTGLKDIKGVEIFEGDIIQWGEPNSSCGIGVARVAYNEKCARFDLMLEDGWFNLADENGDVLGGMVVEGNIYENPELLSEAR